MQLQIILTSALAALSLHAGAAAQSVPADRGANAPGKAQPAVPLIVGDAPPPPEDAVAATGSRAGENAVRSAADAFGTSVGRESIGIYDQDNVRGFSPIIAGNIRFDGLYFDPVQVPTSRLVRTTTIGVGLSALGSPFPAPTGIVDFGFRRPGDTAAASALVSIDGWGGAAAELDAVLPVGTGFSLGLGVSTAREIIYNGTEEVRSEATIIARWAPLADIEIVPFASVIRNWRDEAGPDYIPATDALPPRLPRRDFIGPAWVYNSGVDLTAGILVDWQIAPAWQLRAGVFRSQSDSDLSFDNLVRDIRPDGSARHQIVVDPGVFARKTSGELRLTHASSDGPRQHQFHATLRRRATDRQFGGADVIELGPTQLGQPNRSLRPQFDFGPQQDDNVRQWAAGLAYEGRWDDVGEFSAGLQGTDYAKRVTLVDAPPVATDARLLLYNVTLAVNLSPRLVAYGGAVTGLEESGIAPGNAANRNEALPAIETRQYDAGLRYAFTSGITFVAGVFDIAKPYYNLGSDGRFDQLGKVINRGIEASVAGALTDTLSVVAGGVLLWPRVTGEAVDLGRVGPRPVGAIGQRLEFSGDWRPAFAPGASLDVRLGWRSAEISTVSNRSEIPAYALVDLGGRYAFRLGDRAAVLRVQIANLLDREGLEQGGSGVYSQLSGRSVEAYVTVDF